MKSTWLVLAVLFPLFSLSQDKKSSPAFTAISSLGFAAGESTAKPLFQVSGGVTYDRFFGGLGVGMDFYNYKSIPLFADWRFSFGKTRIGFLYANAGYNFSYDNKNEEEVTIFTTTNSFSGGFYADLGLGCRFRLNERHRLLLSAGYSQKNISRKIGYTFPCVNPPCSEEVYEYHYSLGRLVTKLGWEFGR